MTICWNDNAIIFMSWGVWEIENMQPNGTDLMKICENHAKMELCDNSSSEYDENDHLIVNGNFNTSLGEHCDSIMLLTAHYNGCHFILSGTTTLRTQFKQLTETLTQCSVGCYVKREGITSKMIMKNNVATAIRSRVFCQSSNNVLTARNLPLSLEIC